MSGWDKRWRTLAKDGETEHYETEQQAKDAARRIADETGQWCGIEHHTGTGWWLTDHAAPRERTA